MEEVQCRTSRAPLASPCLCLFLIGLEAKGVFDFQGRHGITSNVARWNLRPVIFAVEFLFETWCCRQKSLLRNSGVGGGGQSLILIPVSYQSSNLFEIVKFWRESSSCDPSIPLEEFLGPSGPKWESELKMSPRGRNPGVPKS